MSDQRNVIAIREYALDGRDGAVRIELDLPIRTAGHDDFCCTFRIIGLGPAFNSHACGVDAVQAMLLTLKKIGAMLHSSEEWQSGRLTWLGRPNDLGLPLLDRLKGP